MAPQTLGQLIALATFCAATSMTLDAVIAIKVGMVRLFGRRYANDRVFSIALFKSATGRVAFALSFIGFILFADSPQ